MYFRNCHNERRGKRITKRVTFATKGLIKDLKLISHVQSQKLASCLPFFDVKMISTHIICLFFSEDFLFASYLAVFVSWIEPPGKMFVFSLIILMRNCHADDS